MALITGAQPQHHEHMVSAKYHKMRDGVTGSAVMVRAVVSKNRPNQNPTMVQAEFSQATAESRLSKILASASLNAALTQESHGANCVSERMALPRQSCSWDRVNLISSQATSSV